MKRTTVLLGMPCLILFAVAALAQEGPEAGTDKALTRLDEATQKHVSVLRDLLSEVPEEARPAIRESIHLSQHERRKTHEAVRSARIKDPLRRAEFRWEQASSRVQEMSQLRDHQSGGYARILAGEYRQAVQNTLAELGHARRQGIGIDRALEKVRAGTQRHLKALERAAAHAPEQAQEALQHAKQYSLTGRRSALSALEGARGRRPDHGRKPSGGPPAKIRGGGPPVGRTEDENDERRKGKGTENRDARGGPPAGVGRP